MNLKELINSSGKSDAKTMEAVTDIIGDFLRQNVSEEAYCSLYKDIYSELIGGHYNKGICGQADTEDVLHRCGRQETLCALLDGGRGERVV